MIEETGERKSAVATPDGKSRKKKKKGMRGLWSIMSFNASKHRGISKTTCRSTHPPIAQFAPNIKLCSSVVRVRE